MQILEASALGLRSARLRFNRAGSAGSVMLYPMVHIGEESFYPQSFDEAFSHDVVLVEGLRSPVARNLTRSYRWIDLAKLDLVRQPGTPSKDAVSAHIVLADLTTDEFHHEWQKVPMLLRGIVHIAAPFVGAYRRLFASRGALVRGMSLEDRLSSDEMLNWDPTFEKLNHSLVHARDARLVACMAMELERQPDKHVAVLYGAEHMRAVAHALSERGFHCLDALRAGHPRSIRAA